MPPRKSRSWLNQGDYIDCAHFFNWGSPKMSSSRTSSSNDLTIEGRAYARIMASVHSISTRSCRDQCLVHDTIVAL